MIKVSTISGTNAAFFEFLTKAKSAKFITNFFFSYYAHFSLARFIFIIISSGFCLSVISKIPRKLSL